MWANDLKGLERTWKDLKGPERTHGFSAGCWGCFCLTLKGQHTQGRLIRAIWFKMIAWNEHATRVMSNWITLPQNDGFTKTYLPSEPMSNASAGRSKSQGLLCDTLYSQHSPDKLPRANCSPLLQPLGQNTFMICPPKVAHLVETVSLGSKSFQTGVTLGAACTRHFFCRCNLAELRTYIRGQVVERSY